MAEELQWNLDFLDVLVHNNSETPEVEPYDTNHDMYEGKRKQYEQD
jgi:hypothetical protein